MRLRNVATLGCLALALSSGVAACSDDDGDGQATGGSAGTTSLTIYSSLPLQGESRAQSQSIVNGMKLALQEAGGKVGDFTIKFQSLDDASAGSGTWEPSQVAANARKAAQDQSTIAYLGELDSGASAISIPVLNQAGILQISPRSTYPGLSRAAGSDKGEPDKYYPSGKRTFGRVVPADHVQAAAQVAYQKDEGCTTVYLLHDRQVDGKGLADRIADLAGPEGLAVVATEGVDVEADNFRSVARDVESEGADCVFFGGSDDAVAARLFRDLHAASPQALLFGSDGVAEDALAARLGRSVAAQVRLTHPALAPRLHPPAGQEFFAEYERRFGEEPMPYAIYGYEAMSLALDAIRRAGGRGGDRQAVIDAFFETEDRESVLGEYSIDDSGDTTLSDYGTYRIEGDELAFDDVVDAGT